MTKTEELLGITALDNEAPLFSDNDVRERFHEVHVLGDLWACVRHVTPTWVSVSFLEVVTHNPDRALLCHLFTSGGPQGALRECRHTYFGLDGYIPYLNFKHMHTALSFLEKYFDGD